MQSLTRSIAATYVSQAYVILIGILMLPLYFKYMGAEAYGLIGFFAMLQVWFNLLDIGLTPTISRETSRFTAGAIDALQFRRLFRMLSLIFFTISVVGGGILLMLSSVLAKDWLNAEILQLNEVKVAVQVMAVSVALRWMCGLYRGVITGSEMLIWLGAFNIFIATLRFICVYPVMLIFGFTPIVFFVFQFLIAVIEIAGLWIKSKGLLPSMIAGSMPIGWSLAPIKSVIKFSLMIAFTSSVWVMVTQTDKLVLSSILPLAEYGYFSLAVMVASGIMVVGGPISGAIMPRMARLEAKGESNEVIRIYRQSTQLVAIMAGSAAVTFAFCAEPLLWAWTGDRVIASKAAPILSLYAIGNGILAVAAFPYYLQYARGNLRLHFIGHLLLLLILVPSIVLSAFYYGAIGAGYVWILVNALYFLIWVAIVHRKLEPNLHWKWLANDVLMFAIPMVSVGFVIFSININLTTRLDSLTYVVIFGVIVFLFAILASPNGRNFISILKARCVR